jgi:hypothetical protein
MSYLVPTRSPEMFMASAPDAFDTKIYYIIIDIAYIFLTQVMPNCKHIYSALHFRSTDPCWLNL